MPAKRLRPKDSEFIDIANMKRIDKEQLQKQIKAKKPDIRTDKEKNFLIELKNINSKNRNDLNRSDINQRNQENTKDKERKKEIRKDPIIHENHNKKQKEQIAKKRKNKSKDKLVNQIQQLMEDENEFDGKILESKLHCDLDQIFQDYVADGCTYEKEINKYNTKIEQLIINSKITCDICKSKFIDTDCEL